MSSVRVLAVPEREENMHFIDRLAVEVDAGVEATWEALVDVLTRSLEGFGTHGYG
jgi:hypothetical protein